MKSCTCTFLSLKNQILLSMSKITFWGQQFHVMGGCCKSIALQMHIAKLFLVKLISMNCPQWDWTDSSNSWKVATNLFSLSIERLDELEMLEKVSWKSSNYLVWWRCLPLPLPPTRLKAARPAPGTWCIIVLVKKYPLYDRAMWSPTALHARSSMYRV